MAQFSSSDPVVILSFARTPMGAMQGALADVSATQLGATAVKAAVELSAKYINDRKLPDKAIDVIDEAGAANTLLPEAKKKKTLDRKSVV